jgi:hypothetical protein
MTMLMFMYAIGGVLLILLAIPLYLGKIPPNGLYGFRVRKTMEHPEIWYPVNKYSARWFMATGVLTVFTAFGLSLIPDISLDAYSLACLAVFTVILGVGISFTVRYMNSL